MKVIDRPVELGHDFWNPDCGQLMCPLILPVPQYARILEAIKFELIDVCSRDFYRACGDFGKIVGPICPFDPVREFKMDKILVEVEELRAIVERLGGGK